MKTSVELQDTFSYMPIWLILVFVFVAVVLFLQIFFRVKLGDKLKWPKKIRVKKPSPKTLGEIKLKYLGDMNSIEDDLRSGKITIRKAYNRMSACIRGFTFEATGIPVDKYTLAEIKKVGIPALTQLVSEYYEPEFARFTYADINQSIYKTRKVLELWH